MATEIPLYMRKELPPARAGIAKPPYELAERPEVQFGQTLARFSGDVFDKLVGARAANEESEFYGIVNTHLEGWETFVADRPNASYDELQKERGKIMTAITAAGQKATTGLAKANITNWYARNKNLLYVKMQTMMEAISSRQQLGRYQVQRENHIANFDKDKLANLNIEMVNSGFLDREITKYQQEQDFAKIDAAEIKFLFEQAKSAVLEVAQSFRDEKGEIDLKAGQDYIKSLPDLPADVKLEILQDLNAWNTQEQRASEAALKEQQEATDIEFFGRYGVDLTPTDVRNAVKEHRLDRVAGDRWLNLLSNPRDFPTDPNTEAKILRDLTDPEAKIATSDILDLVGKPKGLSTATARRFIADMDFFTDPWFKRTDMFLKNQLGWDGAYEKFMHPEGGLAYKLASDKLFAAIESEKLRGRAIYDEGTSIAIPFVIDYWEKVLMLEPAKVEKLKRLLGREPEAPKAKPKTKPKAAEKKRRMFDPLGIF